MTGSNNFICICGANMTINPYRANFKNTHLALECLNKNCKNFIWFSKRRIV